MTPTWKRWLAASCVALACAPALAQKQGSIVVDGSDWISASATERRAYLVGAGNMIAAELAYAKRRNVAPAPVSEQVSKAVSQMPLDEVEARITNWYNAHPGSLSTPVMGVVWRELVKRGP